MGLDMNSVYSRLGGQVGDFESQLNGAIGGGQADDMQSLLMMQYHDRRDQPVLGVIGDRVPPPIILDRRTRGAISCLQIAPTP